MAKAISGLAKAAQDPQSGAEAGYWVLTQYTVKLLQGKTQAALRLLRQRNRGFGPTPTWWWRLRVPRPVTPRSGSTRT